MSSLKDVRSLTEGEKVILRVIFAQTFPYEELVVSRNDGNLGGKRNSITAGTIAMFAIHIWQPDFTAASDFFKWTFIHEMTHVWQTFHGNSNQWCAIKLWWKYDKYDDAYFYNLNDYESFSDFNMEQQAAITADYWFVLRGLSPRKNKGPVDPAAYESLIAQLRASGPPMDPLRWVKFANRSDSRPL